MKESEYTKDIKCAFNGRAFQYLAAEKDDVNHNLTLKLNKK